MPDIIKTMQLLNYSPNLKGMCFGISAMAAQASLRKDSETFANRIKFIQNCTEAQIETIKNSEKNEGNNFDKKLELLCFFDGLSVYQGTTEINFDFRTINSIDQNIEDSKKIIKSEIIKHDSKFAYPEIKLSIVNVFTRREFLNFIKGIKKYFGQQPFSIMISYSSVSHSTQIGFDGENWLSTNHDEVVIGKNNFEDLKKVVDNVFISERYDSTDYMAALFNVLLFENTRVNLEPLRMYNFSSENVTDFLNKKILSQILESYLKSYQYESYIDILHKIKYLKLTENDKINLIESKRLDGTTAFQWIAGLDELNVLKQLLIIMKKLDLSTEAAFNIINRKNNLGLSALYYAAQNGHEKIIKLLLDLTSNLNDKFLKTDFVNAGESALLAAASHGYANIVNMLLEVIFSIDDESLKIKLLFAKNRHNMPILFIPAQNGYVDVVNTLIDSGISLIKNENTLFQFLNAQRAGGITALFIAAQQGYENIVKSLINAIDSIKNEDIKAEFIRANPKKNCGQSALFIAAKNGHAGVVRELIKAIFTIKDTAVQYELLLAKTSVGVSAWSVAIQNGHAEVVHELVGAILSFKNKSVQVELLNARNNEVASTLLLEAKNGRRDVVQALVTAILSTGDEAIQFELLNAKDNEGASALLLGAKHGHLNVVCELVNAILSIENKVAQIELLNAKDNEGASALLLEAKNGHEDTVQALVTAILSTGDEAIQFELLNVKDNEGASALLLGAKNGHLNVVYELLNAILSIENKAAQIELLNARDNEGASALFVAAKNGHKDVVEALIEAIRTVKDKETRITLLSATDKNNRSILSIAAQKGHKDIVRLLCAALEKERKPTRNCLNVCTIS